MSGTNERGSQRQTYRSHRGRRRNSLNENENRTSDTVSNHDATFIRGPSPRCCFLTLGESLSLIRGPLPRPLSSLRTIVRPDEGVNISKSDGTQSVRTLWTLRMDCSHIIFNIFNPT